MQIGSRHWININRYKHTRDFINFTLCANRANMWGEFCGSKSLLVGFSDKWGGHDVVYGFWLNDWLILMNFIWLNCFIFITLQYNNQFKTKAVQKVPARVTSKVLRNALRSFNHSQLSNHLENWMSENISNQADTQLFSIIKESTHV